MVTKFVVKSQFCVLCLDLCFSYIGPKQNSTPLKMEIEITDLLMLLPDSSY